MKNTSEAKTLAFVEAIQSGKRKTLATAIYYLLTDKSMTTEQLRNLGFSHQSVTATLSHLEDLGLIYKSALVDGTKRKYTLWKVEQDKDKILSRRNQIAQDKYENWVKKGNEMGYFTKMSEG